MGSIKFATVQSSSHFKSDVVRSYRCGFHLIKAIGKETCKHTDPTIRMLFNAYTEKKFIDHIKDYELFLHMDGIYADSGGLQMVTTGKTVNPEIKDGNHDVQTFPMQCVLMISLRTRVISSYT